MTNLFRNLGFGALMITGLMTADAYAQQAQKGGRPQPLTEMRTGVPATSIRAGTSLKIGPTIVPVVDSNAILNLDYKEMRSAPAPVAKVVAPKPVVHEPTLAELQLQLKVARDEYKAAKLAYTQAVRAKDKTRIDAAKVNRAAAQQKVTDLQKAIAAKQPAAKAKKRGTPKKKSGGAKANATVSATAK